MAKRDLLCLLPSTGWSLFFSLLTLYVGDCSLPLRRRSLGRSGPNDPELTPPTLQRSLIRSEVSPMQAIKAGCGHAPQSRPLDTPLLGGTSDSGFEAEKKNWRPARRVPRNLNHLSPVHLKSSIGGCATIVPAARSTSMNPPIGRLHRLAT